MKLLARGKFYINDYSYEWAEPPLGERGEPWLLQEADDSLGDMMASHGHKRGSASRTPDWGLCGERDWVWEWLVCLQQSTKALGGWCQDPLCTPGSVGARVPDTRWHGACTEPVRTSWTLAATSPPPTMPSRVQTPPRQMWHCSVREKSAHAHYRCTLSSCVFLTYRCFHP